jgi:DNA modification methylase
VLADRHGVIIAGNKTVQEATTQGLPIRVVETTGDALVVVQRVDLDLATDDRARQLALADNRIGELNLEWDPALMASFATEGLAFRDLWTDDELEQLVGHGRHAGRADEDAQVPIRETTLQSGDLLELGSHRLLCGDATQAADVARVLQEDQPAILITDPPYGVSYDPRWRVEAGRSGRHALGRVTNDHRADWREALAHYPGPVAYIWHAGVHTGTVAASLTDAGFDIRAQIIWVKPHFVLSRGDFHWQHEPCFYAVRTGARSNWRGGRDQSTIWAVPNLNPFAGGHDADNPETGHATQKPVALYERALQCNTAPHDVLLDLFAGSGTAVIAAEKTGRRCCAIELEPTYVQMIVDRWEAYTGRTATRHETAARR